MSHRPAWPMVPEAWDPWLEELGGVGRGCRGVSGQGPCGKAAGALCPCRDKGGGGLGRVLALCGAPPPPVLASQTPSAAPAQHGAQAKGTLGCQQRGSLPPRAPPLSPAPMLRPPGTPPSPHLL